MRQTYLEILQANIHDPMWRYALMNGGCRGMDRLMQLREELNRHAFEILGWSPRYRRLLLVGPEPCEATRAPEAIEDEEVTF